MRFFRRLMPALVLPLIALFTLSLVPHALLAQEEHSLTVAGIPTNLGLAHELTTRVAAQTLAELGNSLAIDCLYSRAAAEHSAVSLVELAFAEAARVAGMQVATDEGLCGTVLEYNVLDLRIAYTGTDRSALGLKKEIERYGICVIASRLVDAETGEELANTQQEVLLSDRFPYDLKNMVKSDRYPFTAPELSERSWSKSIEPIVVTAMISGLIYLFFSNQSSE